MNAEGNAGRVLGCRRERGIGPTFHFGEGRKFFFAEVQLAVVLQPLGIGTDALSAETPWYGIDLGLCL